MAEIGLGEEIARLGEPCALNQDAPGQDTDRAFEHAHVCVGDHVADIGFLQQCADIRQKHRIV